MGGEFGDLSSFGAKDTLGGGGEGLCPLSDPSFERGRDIIRGLDIVDEGVMPRDGPASLIAAT
jgi:hypothetical protein